MFTRLRLMLVVTVIGLMAGIALAVASGGVEAQQTQSQFQSASVVTFENPDGSLSDFTPVPGGATLIRTNEGLSYDFHTTQLNPGSAYTMWVVIFNKPQNCQGVEGCLPPDLSLPSVQASILYGGSSHIAGEEGYGHFQGSVEEGSPASGISVNIPLGTANGLMDPMNAEIHLMVHDHGPIIAGLAVDQLSTFTGGCSNPGYPEEWGGMRGDFFCATTQLAVFPAP